MPLHYKTKESAVKKYSQLPADKLRGAIEGDANNYQPEDVEEILAAIALGATQGSASPSKESRTSTAEITPAAGSVNPNAAIADKLAAFDYNRMTGEAFKKYALFVQTLPIEKAFDFEVYAVEVVKNVRYKGIKDSPVDTVGFKIKNMRPIHTTRIPVKHALVTNGRVEPFRDTEGNAEETGFEVTGCQLDHNGSNGRYYLLKKVS